MESVSRSGCIGGGVSKAGSCSLAVARGLVCLFCFVFFVFFTCCYCFDLEWTLCCGQGVCLFCLFSLLGAVVLVCSGRSQVVYFSLVVAVLIYVLKLFILVAVVLIWGECY